MGRSVDSNTVTPVTPANTTGNADYVVLTGTNTLDVDMRGTAVGADPVIDDTLVNEGDYTGTVSTTGYLSVWNAPLNSDIQQLSEAFFEDTFDPFTDGVVLAGLLASGITGVTLPTFTGSQVQTDITDGGGNTLVNAGTVSGGTFDAEDENARILNLPNASFSNDVTITGDAGDDEAAFHYNGGAHDGDVTTGDDVSFYTLMNTGGYTAVPAGVLSLLFGLEQDPGSGSWLGGFDAAVIRELISTAPSTAAVFDGTVALGTHEAVIFNQGAMTGTFTRAATENDPPAPFINGAAGTLGDAAGDQTVVGVEGPGRHFEVLNFGTITNTRLNAPDFFVNIGNDLTLDDIFYDQSEDAEPTPEILRSLFNEGLAMGAAPAVFDGELLGFNTPFFNLGDWNASVTLIGGFNSGINGVGGTFDADIDVSNAIEPSEDAATSFVNFAAVTGNYTSEAAEDYIFNIAPTENWDIELIDAGTLFATLDGEEEVLSGLLTDAENGIGGVTPATWTGDISTGSQNDVFTNFGSVTGTVDLGDDNDSGLLGGSLTSVALGNGADAATILSGVTFTGLDAGDADTEQDIISFHLFGAGAVFDAEAGTLSGDGSAGSGITGFEAVFGSAFSDDVTGSDKAELFTLDTGNDSARGGGGDDSILGGDGVDTLIGGDGNDVIGQDGGGGLIEGGAGIDLIGGGNGADTVFGGADADGISGFEGDDSLDGGLGNDTVIGGAGADIIAGRSGDDLLYGDEAPGLSLASAAAAAALTLPDLGLA